MELEFIDPIYTKIGLVVVGLIVMKYGKTEPIIICGIALCACGIFW